MGALASVGLSGYSYSSSTKEAYSLFVDFHTQGFSPSYTNGRGFGFQLRCLSE
ncbi:hypothetical protein [uncultured Rikenella sp.]|uniref:hypothetical protein n=1 Tax=uncultured Rikenella sp. TaxID=368003 RepID=UPI00262D1A0B|nr:hypothetical protein [uncultured Rikenella sp.]